MESKIAIDVDEKGRPMIRIEYAWGTDDLRDKIIGRFVCHGDKLGAAPEKAKPAFFVHGHEHSGGRVDFITLYEPTADEVQHF